MTKLINLTPHVVTLQKDDGERIEIPSSGRATLVYLPGTVVQADDIPVPVCIPGRVEKVEGLPSPEDGTVFVVSMPVAEHLRGRRGDVVCPATGPADNAIRDEKGQIVAVTRLNWLK